MLTQNPTPDWTRTPKDALTRPAVEATDRSMSALIITRVMGRAMRSVAVTSRVRNVSVRGWLNLGIRMVATAMARMRMRVMCESREENTRRIEAMRSRDEV